MAFIYDADLIEVLIQRFSSLVDGHHSGKLERVSCNAQSADELESSASIETAS